MEVKILPGKRKNFQQFLGSSSPAFLLKVPVNFWESLSERI
jgi:hypothetical protein